MRRLLAYALPLALAGPATAFWFLYCFVLPIGHVDALWMMDRVPEGAACTPWEADPGNELERRTCHFDQPFHRYTILEFREPGSPAAQQPIRKDVWCDPKWYPIAAATFAGTLLFAALWVLWVRWLRRIVGQASA